MPHEIKNWRSLLVALVVAVLSGCAASPPEIAFAPPVYPAPPDEPRFIYERSLRFNTNVEKLTRSEKLRRYATGGDADLKGLVKPYGVAVKYGRVFVTDTVQRSVILFDTAKGRYREFGHDKPAELSKPAGIAISALNEIFIADVGRQRIAVFDINGKFLRLIGGPELFKRPTGVAVSSNGLKLYVVDTGGVDNDNHHLYILDTLTGAVLSKVGSRGTKEGDFNLPLLVDTAADDTIYVVDKGNFRVQAFSQDGRFKHSFGTAGQFPGQFFSPKGIAIDKDGNIYVVDTAFGNVQVFDPSGQLLMVIGERGQSSKPGNYMLPAGIDIDETGRVYVVDQFFRKVDVYRPIAQATQEETTDKEK
ncbi:6-bladed beta-propeller [Pseudomonadota bacterium]